MSRSHSKGNWRRLALLLPGLALLLCSAFTLVWLQPGSVVRALSSAVDYTPVPVAALNMTCVDETEPQAWSYCINRVPNSRSTTLVYHFHGRRGNARWWNDDSYYSGDLYREWAQQGIAPPTVVSISFGPLWLLEQQGRLKVFREQIVPHIESTLNTEFDRRLVVGESMGGFNALLVWLNTGAQFDGAAALCPPLPTVSPDASLGELTDYLSTSSTSLQRAGMMLLMGRYLFPDEQSWQHNSPLALAAQRNLKAAGTLYLSCGKQDDWGCMAGSKQLLARAQSRGARVLWHPQPGGHCDIDRVSLAGFLGSGPERAAAELDKVGIQ